MLGVQTRRHPRAPAHSRSMSTQEACSGRCIAQQRGGGGGGDGHRASTRIQPALALVLWGMSTTVATVQPAARAASATIRGCTSASMEWRLRAAARVRG